MQVCYHLIREFNLLTIVGITDIFLIFMFFVGYISKFLVKVGLLLVAKLRSFEAGVSREKSASSASK